LPFKRYVEIFDEVAHQIQRWVTPTLNKQGLPYHPLITGNYGLSHYNYTTFI
jgi:hypothetical protein